MTSDNLDQLHLSKNPNVILDHWARINKVIGTFSVDLYNVIKTYLACSAQLSIMTEAKSAVQYVSPESRLAVRYASDGVLPKKYTVKIGTPVFQTTAAKITFSVQTPQKYEIAAAEAPPYIKIGLTPNDDYFRLLKHPYEYYKLVFTISSKITVQEILEWLWGDPPKGHKYDEEGRIVQRTMQLWAYYKGENDSTKFEKHFRKYKFSYHAHDDNQDIIVIENTIKGLSLTLEEFNTTTPLCDCGGPLKIVNTKAVERCCYCEKEIPIGMVLCCKSTNHEIRKYKCHECADFWKDAANGAIHAD